MYLTSPTSPPLSNAAPTILGSAHTYSNTHTYTYTRPSDYITVDLSRPTVFDSHPLHHWPQANLDNNFNIHPPD